MANKAPRTPLVVDGVTYDPFWRKAQPGGVTPKVYETPAELWAAAVDAFEWLTTHPLKEEQLFHYKGAVKSHYARKMRPFTWEGVALLMGLHFKGLKTYWDRPEFVEVMEYIADVIRTQKFEGAAAGFLNASLIARDLGLADRSELSGPNGGPVQTEEVSARDLILERLNRRAAVAGAPGDAGRPDGDPT